MRATGLLVCAIAASFTLGCSADDSGLIQVALTGQAASGTSYRLREAELIISGGGAVQVFHTEDDRDRTGISSALAPGAYTLAVPDGWRLERQRSDGSFEPTLAVMTSANPLPFTIVAGAATRATLRFTAGTDDVQLDDGRVDVDLGVDEVDAGPPGTPDASIPDAAIPDAATADAAGPDAAGPDAAGPDATRPDAALPDAGSAVVATGNDMLPGEILIPGTSLSGGFLVLYTFRMRSDGVVDLLHNNNSVWSSGVAGAVLIMQLDGNLVLYTADGTPVWATDTWGHSGASLRVDNTGVAVLLGSTILWDRW